MVDVLQLRLLVVDVLKLRFMVVDVLQLVRRLEFRLRLLLDVLQLQLMEPEAKLPWREGRWRVRRHTVRRRGRMGQAALALRRGGAKNETAAQGASGIDSTRRFGPAVDALTSNMRMLTAGVAYSWGIGRQAASATYNPKSKNYMKQTTTL